MGRAMPEATSAARLRMRWEGDRRYDPRVTQNNVDATPLSYAMYVVCNSRLADYLDPSRPLLEVIAAVDPDWQPQAMGALLACLVVSLD